MSRMAGKPPTPPEASGTPSDSAITDEAMLIAFVTQAFTALFSRLSDLAREVGQLKTAIDSVDGAVKTRLGAIQPHVEEMLSNVREHRRSSVTHYSQLAASVAQGFESLGELRAARTDKQTLELLSETLSAVQDALYCLRMERLTKRYLDLQQKRGTSKATDSDGS